MSLIDLLLLAIERKKNKSTRYSALDQIAGLGPKRKKNLLNYYKSLEKLKGASLDDLCKIQGISHIIAKEIKEKLTQ